MRPQAVERSLDFRELFFQHNIYREDGIVLKQQSFILYCKLNIFLFEHSACYQQSDNTTKGDPLKKQSVVHTIL
jgi:hypothetical protein